jgi:class 3 adenylate cyclase
MLIEFASAVDAVICAMSVQEKMAERNAGSSSPNIAFRVGINVGDIIIIDDDDIFGDGVNSAMTLCALTSGQHEAGQTLQEFYRSAFTS